MINDLIFREEMRKLREEFADIKIILLGIARVLSDFEGYTEDFPKRAVDIFTRSNTLMNLIKDKHKRPTLSWEEDEE